MLLCILIPLIVGGISGVASIDNLQTWYLTLHKPFFNPPNTVFGPVWTCLYILMGISLYEILQGEQTIERSKAVLIFFLQLLLNFLWSFIFFRWKMMGVAFVEILLLWLSVLGMMRSFYFLNKRAGVLQIPYLVWVSFAALLNFAIWYLN
jgi:tryptophan-rich sensory protein